MNPRVIQLWHPFAVGLLRAAKVFRDIGGDRHLMRESAREAIAYQRKVDPTVFRFQASLPLKSDAPASQRRLQGQQLSPGQSSRGRETGELGRGLGETRTVRLPEPSALSTTENRGTEFGYCRRDGVAVSGGVPGSPGSSSPQGSEYMTGTLRSAEFPAVRARSDAAGVSRPRGDTLKPSCPVTGGQGLQNVASDDVGTGYAALANSATIFFFLGLRGGELDE